MVNIGIGRILEIFEPILSIFGIDIGTSTGGTVGGGTATGPSAGGGSSSSQEVNNYYYGPVYFQGAGEPGSYYDCPSPNPFVEASTGTIGGRNVPR